MPESVPPSFLPRQRSFTQPTVNPFIHRITLTSLQKLQVALMSVTIVPLRLLMMTVFFIVVWVFAVLFTIGMPVPPREPAGYLRTSCFKFVRLLCRLILFFAGFHWIQIRGKRATNTEAPLLVFAPHSSLFDAFVICVSDPMPSAVSRIENASIPIIGTLSKTVLPVFVSRIDSDSRQKASNVIASRAKSNGTWPQILIFPEGTCTNRKALITFKAGAFSPGVPVQPVIVEYLNNLDTFSWTDKGPSTLTVIWLSLCQISLRARVTYLPVYKPCQKEIEDARLYAHNVRAIMAEALGIPFTDHTFEDCRLMRQAASLNLPMEAGLIEFTKISRKLGMDINSVEDKLSEFSQIATERSDGLISKDDFAKFLNLPITPALEEMFHLYDRDGSGYIDFREYVIGLSLVSQPAVTEDTLKLAFKLFDSDGNGVITYDEFNHVLHATFGEEIKGSDIFEDIKKARSDRVTFDEFHSFVVQRPEYAKLFLWYYEMEQDNVDSDFENPKHSRKERKVVVHRKFTRTTNKVESESEN